ncbi:MAG: hypothetical protein SOH80_01830 [Eubacteriales bacterium]|jgi:hypothetical protein
MLDFDEELKKFKPSLEMENIEDVVRHEDLTDIIEVLRDLGTEARQEDAGDHQ